MEMSVAAASLYGNLTTKGLAIRKPDGGLIIVIGINNNFPLVQHDKDFDNIAKHTSLKIYKTD